MSNALAEFDAVLAKPDRAPRSSGDPLAEFDATPAVAPKQTPKAARDASAQGQQPVSAAVGQPDAADQVLRSMVQNTGASIIAGWRGMATLATGGTLDDAANNVNEELENRSYHPESERVAAVMASPWNPLNWFGIAGKKIGETAQDLGAPPSVAAGMETAVNAAPLLLMRKGNEPVRGPVRFANESAAEGAAEAAKAHERQSAFEPAVLPLEEQMRRGEVLRRIGVTEARKSSLSGDLKESATDFQQSKVANQAGDFMKAKLDAERAALTEHAEAIARDTGGTVGNDSSVNYARGQAILGPLDKLSDYFNGQIKRLYKEADAKSEGVKIDMPRLNEAVGGDQAEFLGTTEGEALLKGVKARMRSLGIQEGEGGGVTVGQAERLKQYLNNVWQPRTGKLIRSLRDAIDDDVTSSAGEDIYAQARALRRMRVVTLDEPNGIGKLMDASGPEGINRAVPVE